MSKRVIKITVVGRGSLSGLKALALFIGVFSTKGSTQVRSLIPDVKENHCSEILGTADSAVFACQVWDGRPDLFSSPRQIEIFRKGERLQSIDPGAQIVEWHLWKGGKQIAVHFGHPGTYALYDTVTGSVLERSAKK